MVAAIRYDSKAWAAGIVTSWARESSARGRSDTGGRGDAGGRGDDRGQGDGRASREEAWRALDRQLRTIAARRAALDAEELALIRAAIAIQLAAGRKIALTAAELETAECDAVHIGSVEVARHGGPPRRSHRQPGGWWNSGTTTSARCRGVAPRPTSICTTSSIASTAGARAGEPDLALLRAPRRISPRRAADRRSRARPVVPPAE